MTSQAMGSSIQAGKLKMVKDIISMYTYSQNTSQEGKKNVLEPKMETRIIYTASTSITDFTEAIKSV